MEMIYNIYALSFNKKTHKPYPKLIASYKKKSSVYYAAKQLKAQKVSFEIETVVR